MYKHGAGDQEDVQGSTCLSMVPNTKEETRDTWEKSLLLVHAECSAIHPEEMGCVAVKKPLRIWHLPSEPLTELIIMVALH